MQQQNILDSEVCILLELNDDRLHYWILKGHEPVPCTLMEWAIWFEKGDLRRIALDEKYGILVSTVFLGIDHKFGFGAPLLFETMIFGGRHDQYQERYSTWDEAVEGHKQACVLAFPTGFLGGCELFLGTAWRWCVREMVKAEMRLLKASWYAFHVKKEKKN